MADERVDAIEQRVAKLESDFAMFQTAVLKKLAKALQLVQRHQKMRDARVNAQLKRIAGELERIREKLGQQAPPTMN
jgi:uncharacterized coiled-coil protein SlyX